jgi:hypothetical protein
MARPARLSVGGQGDAVGERQQLRHLAAVEGEVKGHGPRPGAGAVHRTSQVQRAVSVTVTRPHQADDRAIGAKIIVGLGKAFSLVGLPIGFGIAVIRDFPKEVPCVALVERPQKERGIDRPSCLQTHIVGHRPERSIRRHRHATGAEVRIAGDIAFDEMLDGFAFFGTKKKSLPDPKTGQIQILNDFVIKNTG